MAMKTSKAGILAILDHEAVVLSRYKDSVGVWTIFVGHTASAGPPNPKTAPQGTLTQALEVFERDLAKFEKRVNDAVKVPISQHQFDALVSFDFNTGGIFKAKLTKSLNAGNVDLAGDQFMGWTKPPEIIGRRKKEQALFRTGEYPNITKLKVYNVFPGTMHRVDVPAAYRGTGTPTTKPESKGGWAAIFTAILKLFTRK